MILAAGEGSRLRPLTIDRPKPMIEIAGAPILEHNVRRLVEHGFTEIVINLHHAPEAIVAHFGDGARFGARISYSREEHLLGTAGGVKRAAHLLGPDFLVVYGDNLSLCDFTALFKTHVTKAAWLTMGLFEREDPTASGIVDVGPDGRIRRYLEKPAPEQVFSHWVNAGVLALSAEVLGLIAPDKPSDFGHDVLGSLLDWGAPIYGVPVGRDLWWIDSIADYERTVRFFEDGEAASRLYANSGGSRT
jgi:mannose-1-phosphate guanylyltransferase/phosphomannomutase